MFRIKIWLRVIFSLILTFGGVKSNILSAEETVEEILKNNRSLIRFGDGEFGIYKGKDIHYQKHSAELEKAFIKIKETFEETNVNCPFLLAVPKKYMQCSGFELCKKRVLVSSWSEARRFFKKNFNLSLCYGDAFLFEKINNQIYSRLWNSDLNKKSVIFIHNNEEYARQFEEKYLRKCFFVQCPSKNAFEELERLQSDVLNIIAKNSLKKEQVQIVVSAGPAGKVLAYGLSMQGYHCIDAGHCWDDPLES